MKHSVLRVENLSKTYGKIVAVDDISFDVQAGEIFALIGPNGAGKSTTLRMLATLLRPSGGTATIAGHNLATSAAQVREVISYLPEEAGAYKNLAGLDYLKFMGALYAHSKDDFTKMLTFGQEISGLGDRLHDKISTYSKGMTRKLLLARTVMSKPQLAILDEPTSGLDVINAYEIRTIIKRLAGEGMAVLLSSHNMLEIENLSDRVAIIDKGRILATGSPVELKTTYKAANLEEVFIKVAV